MTSYFSRQREAPDVRSPEKTRIWRCGRFSFAVGEHDMPIVMGIVNVTPDSFSDGGLFASTEAAIAHGRRLAAEGAQILDVGGESTRPGAPTVSAEEELARVLPVIKTLGKDGFCVSIDTRKYQVLAQAIKAGAVIVNDVTALQFENSAHFCAKAGVGVVLMHMQGEPQTMQASPSYADVVGEVAAFLQARGAACEAAGIAREAIAIDPGFGFGKTLEHNLDLTRNLSRLVEMGYPVLAGWSRKSTIGKLTGRTVASERVAGSVAAALVCAENGARILRVHDVAETVDALKVWNAMREGSAG